MIYQPDQMWCLGQCCILLQPQCVGHKRHQGSNVMRCFDHRLLSTGPAPNLQRGMLGVGREKAPRDLVERGSTQHQLPPQQ